MSQGIPGCPVHRASAGPTALSASRSPHRNAEQFDPHDLEMTSFLSTVKARAQASVVQIDSDMQAHYDRLRTGLLPHLSPVIIVNNEARGGEYTLVFNGTTETLCPIPKTFELAKSVAHIPLGIFSIIAPYLNGSTNAEWASALSDFGGTLRNARGLLSEAEMPQDLEASSRIILDAGLAYIEDTLAGRQISIASFQKLSSSVYPSIRTNMQFAAEAQILGVREIMKTWKQKIGEERWRDLYVVVLSLWTTSVLNQNSIILRTLMDPDRVNSHLIDLPTAEFPADPVFIALDNLARIVQDNVAAGMVFPTDQVVADALKGPEDLLSQTILSGLDDRDA